jgi:hypothetical protein
MERKVLFYWLAQIGGWGAYFFFTVFLLFNAGDELKYTLNLFLYISASTAASIIISHGIRFAILKFDLLSKQLLVLILWTTLFAIIASFSLEFFQHYFTETVIEIDFIDIPDSPKGIDWANFFFATSRSLMLFLLWSGFYLVFVFIEKARKQEIVNLKWEASNNEIELKNLRAQLNPHFLFNSLNSIRALVGLDPEQAKSAITKLSVLLRHSINLGKMKVIVVKDELELVQNYLELEQIRFEERLSVTYNIDQNTLACEIPPLMLQTIVENSIKHGISKSIDGGSIAIEGTLVNDTLTLKVTNTGKLDSSDDETGVGVHNTRKRLDILYGKNASFDLQQVNNNVVSTITIKYK